VPELLASIRPDSWNVPLFLHVLGAMVLVGAVAATAVSSLAATEPSGMPRLRRLSLRTLLLVAVPAYAAMRGGGEWLYSKEFGDVDDDPAWIGIGYITADAGLILLLLSLVLAGLASRRQSAGLTRATGAITIVLVVAWLVAVWAMGAKPG
jgi:hypothetical protein